MPNDYEIDINHVFNCGYRIQCSVMNGIKDVMFWIKTKHRYLHFRTYFRTLSTIHENNCKTNVTLYALYNQ